jgi:hypothetical protein
MGKYKERERGEARDDKKSVQVLPETARKESECVQKAASPEQLG